MHTHLAVFSNSDEYGGSLLFSEGEGVLLRPSSPSLTTEYIFSARFKSACLWTWLSESWGGILPAWQKQSSDIFGPLANYSMLEAGCTVDTTIYCLSDIQWHPAITNLA